MPLIAESGYVAKIDGPAADQRVCIPSAANFPPFDVDSYDNLLIGFGFYELLDVTNIAILARAPRMLPRTRSSACRSSRSSRSGCDNPTAPSSLR
jgi:hypothetical protein